MYILQVDSLIQVSRLLTGSQNFDRALQVNAAAEKMAIEKIGRESEAYGSCAFNRGRVNYFKKNYPDAEIGYLESKAIREKILGIQHPDYAWSVNNLGVLYYHMGQYHKAEPLYLEAKAIREKVLGKEHPDYAGSLVNIGILYAEMGNYEKAELYYLEAKAIDEKILGKDHPYYASSLNSLAILYDEMGHFEKAEPLYIEAKNIREKVLGKEHPYYAQSLNNLASLYWNMREYDKARLFYLEALTVMEKSIGKEDAAYTQSLSNLAVVYKAMGNYEKAESLHLDALTIKEKVLGKQHPLYSASLFNLAILYSDKGDYKKAEPLAIELSKANQFHLQKAVHHLSEQELGSYLNKFASSQDYTLSITLQSGMEKLVSTCYNNALFYKGFLLQAAGQLKRLANSDPVTRDKFTRLNSYERGLAVQFAKPLRDRDSLIISDLREKANDLQKDLARTVAGFENTSRQIKWEEVQSALKPDEVAIEFVHYHYYQNEQTDSTLYAALLLLPGAPHPTFIPLFEEKAFDHLLASGKERKADYVNNLYAWADRGLVKLGSDTKSLYELIWEKIEATGLDSVSTIYFSPTGILHKLNLGAIAVNEEAILSDRYNLIALNSTRQLVNRQSKNTPGNNKNARIFAGIDFDIDPSLLNDTLNRLEDNDLSHDLAANSMSRISNSRGDSWSSLKWTEKEGIAIAELLATTHYASTLLSEQNATEESFKSLSRGNRESPRILHIATHGFFYPDPDIDHSLHTADQFEPVFKSSDNPMMRSGLILTGGNYAWQHGKPFKPDMEDGVLTAYEISQMDLSNTKLVVLSACETGLGDIQGNEGVYGLQRAFKIAGAEYLVMSLWQVPDRETMEFMTTFYRNWLESKMTIPDAFRKTQREMRDRFFNPYSWAGFVLVE